MCNDDLSIVESTIGICIFIVLHIVTQISACVYVDQALDCCLGVDFMTTVVSTCSETVALQLWDTAGQERYCRTSLLTYICK